MSKAIDLENGLPAIKTWVEGKFVEKEAGKGLSTNDYTTDEKTKLSGIAAGAEVNVQSDWNVTSTTSDAYIKNKPSIPAASSTAPKMDGTAAAGTGTTWARADHVHPTDTSRAPLASPALTGTPTAPTADAGTNTTQIATTAFVKTAVDNVTVADFTPASSSADGTHGLVPAPTSIGEYLKSDEGWAQITAYEILVDDGPKPDTSTVQDYLSDLKDLKVDKETGKGLSTNDYTTAEKNKLAGIAAGAEANVQADWNATDSASDAFIKNKPTIDDALSSTSTNAVQNAVINTALGTKVDKVTGKGLSTNDYTTTEKNKLANIAAGAQVNVIESVKVNGTALSISSKAVDVPKATNSVYGATILSDATDGTAAAASGGTAATPKAVADALAAAKTYADGIAVPSASTTTPKMDGTAAVGTGTTWARADHVHPTDTSRAANVDFTPATTSAAGAAGLVPAPAKNTTTQLLAASGWKDLSLVYNNSGNLQNLVQSKGINGDSLNFQVKRASTNAYGVTILTDSTSSTSSVEAASGKAVSDALAAAKSYADGKVTGLYNYKGSVATYANLPASPATGDVYNVEAAYGDYPAGTNWAWTGTAWDALGGSFTITYATAAEVTAVLEA